MALGGFVGGILGTAIGAAVFWAPLGVTAAFACGVLAGAALLSLVRLTR